MDSARFDNLTRSLTTAGSRRRMLAAALSGASGLVVGASSVDQARAKKTCPPCKRRKQGRCKKKRPNGTACGPGGQICQSGRCRCPGGTTDCSGSCVNLGGDPRNCGSCGKRCGVNEQCVAGQCRCPHQSGGDEICSPGAICCPTNNACSCIGSGQFLDPATCAAVTECPSGSTPCTSTSNVCLNTVPSRVCCPSGTTCTAEGSCLQ
jgi:hypothetical protein